MSNQVTNCEILVTKALSTPIVRRLVLGLEQAGCEFSLPRHVACEPCDDGLAGG